MIEHFRKIEKFDSLYYDSDDVYFVDSQEEEHKLNLMYGRDGELEIDDEMIEKLKQGKILLFTGCEYYSRITYKPQKRPTINENNKRG